MSKRNIKNDIPLLERKKIKVDLITFMYGTLLVRLTKDIKDINELNTKIELIGYDIGKRLVDDLIDDFQRVDTSDQNKLMEKLICQLAQYYLGIIGNYSQTGEKELQKKRKEYENKQKELEEKKILAEKKEEINEEKPKEVVLKEKEELNYQKTDEKKENT